MPCRSSRASTARCPRSSLRAVPRSSASPRGIGAGFGGGFERGLTAGGSVLWRAWRRWAAARACERRRRFLERPRASGHPRPQLGVVLAILSALAHGLEHSARRLNASAANEEARRMRRAAGYCAGRLAGAEEDIAPLGPSDGGAHILGDHQPAERLAGLIGKIGRRHENGQAELVIGGIDGEAPARGQRNALGAERSAALLCRARRRTHRSDSLP